MERTIRRFGIAALLICAAGTLALAQDPVKVSPELYKVDVDNAQVRVLRHRETVKAKSPEHEHPDNVVVYLTDADYKITQACKTTEYHRKRGEVYWNAAAKHVRENIGDKPFEAIQIELKPYTGKAAVVDAALDPLKVDPKHVSKEFENARVRVLRVKRGPHEGTAMHQHPAYLAVFLTDVDQKVTDAAGKEQEAHRKAGEVTFSPPLKHTEMSTADRPLEVIVIELK